MEKKDFIKWVLQLQNNYQASVEVRAQLAQVDLIAIVGPTGVGKTTLIEKLGIPYIMSDVTREKRPDEKDHRNYHFRTDYLGIIEDIQQGNYVQFLVSPFGEFYGTRIAAYPDSGPCTMAIVASVMPLFRNLGFRRVSSIYIMPPSYVEWMRRIGGVRREDLLARIDEARHSILQAQQEADLYSFVLNDNLELALKDIYDILQGKEQNKHRAQLAYDTADIILERIGDDSIEGQV